MKTTAPPDRPSSADPTTEPAATTTPHPDPATLRRPLRVIVVGGGIGGLALGSGLRRLGIDTVVLERDTDLTATGGYHITLDGSAQTALRGLLDPARYEDLLASASALRLRDPDAFFDHRGRRIGTGPGLGSDPSIDVDRVTLRLILAEATGAELRTGSRVTAYGLEDGRPTVTLDDGERLTADLVVAADGTQSTIARRLAGGPTNQPAGIIGFSGRTPADAVSVRERDRLGRRSSLAVGAGGSALYVGFLDPIGNAVLDAPDRRRAVSVGPTYIWGAMFPDAEVAGLRTADRAQLQRELLARFTAQGWAEPHLEVVAASAPASVGVFRFNAAATRPELLAPWPAGPVTALGDAVHATPPTAGMGAGAAIRDAADLVDQLAGVITGQTELLVAVRQYEEGLRERGAAVVGLAMRTVDRILTTATPAGSLLTRAVLPVAALAYRLRRA